MTNLFSPPDTATARSGRARSGRAVTLAGTVAAARAAALSLLAITVLVLVGWASAAQSGASATEAVRAALQVWVLAHHGELVIPGGRLDLVPIGLTVLPGVLLYAAGVRAARGAQITGGRGAAALTAVISSAYALLAAMLAVAGGTASVHPQPVLAFLGAGAVALIAAGAGVVRGTGAAGALWRRVPGAVRLAARGAAGALGVLVGSGALLVAGSLAIHHHRLTQLMRSLDTGLAGGLLLFLLCLLYLPTAVLWSTSYAVGSGFAVGVGTSVAVTGTHLGATPAFPLLAGLPADGSPALAWLVLVAPVGAGMTAGLLLDRHGSRRMIPTWRRALLLAGGSGALAATGLAALVGFGGGSAGPGRMSEVGPTGWLLWLVVAGEIAAIAALTLLARRPRLVRGPPVAADVSG